MALRRSRAIPTAAVSAPQVICIVTCFCSSLAFAFVSTLPAQLLQLHCLAYETRWSTRQLHQPITCTSLYHPKARRSLSPATQDASDLFEKEGARWIKKQCPTCKMKERVSCKASRSELQTLLIGMAWRINFRLLLLLLDANQRVVPLLRCRFSAAANRRFEQKRTGPSPQSPSPPSFRDRHACIPPSSTLGRCHRIIALSSASTPSQAAA